MDILHQTLSVTAY